MLFLLKRITAAVLSLLMSLTVFLKTPSKPMAEFYVAPTGTMPMRVLKTNRLQRLKELVTRSVKSTAI